MVGALFYLQYHSIANRLLMRLRRLRQPKYLLGGIVGALYFYFYFFRYLFGFSGGRRSGMAMMSPSGTHLALYESIGAAIFLIAILLAWLLPHERAALAFSEAEVAFLFPAPITRRGLIHFKLLRSQGAILFTTFFLMLVTNRFGGKFWIHAAGWWVILCTLNLHLLGCSFARTRLMDRGITPWKRRFVVLGLIGACAAAIGIWARKSLPAPNLDQMSNFDAVQNYVQGVLTSGPLPYLLYPFRLVIRPYLAPNVHAFVFALPAALLITFLHYLWVVRADVAFEEASVEASRKTAQKVAAVRSGNLRSANVRMKGRRAPFALGTTGPTAPAFLWKNLISAGQVFTPRLWILFAATATAVCSFLAQFSQHSAIVSALGISAAMLVVWSMFIGPQLLRQDLRQDLALADLLKTYPVPGWELVFGELLGPAAILTALQWLLLLISGALLLTSPPSYLPATTTLAIGASAALVVPVLNVIILQIPNAAVLLFPAWFQVGKDRAQGIEVTGQRIIAIFVQLLAFIVALIPAAIVSGGVFYVVWNLLDRDLAIFLASTAAAIILAAEAASGVVFLGRLFEQFDLSAELPLS
ncbi:MAG TPA: putative ABC exporter domain-containing protein [Verrucomicrobiae bacterium]|nr:putative ABC exporter domain-containing protein [Verrucomicrobiae bacterium]